MNPDKEPDHFLVTPWGISEWERSNGDKGKQNTFADKFRKVRDKLGFRGKVTFNSIRHHAITDLFVKYMKVYKIEDLALEKMLPITGHNTKAALKKYIHKIDAHAYLPDDWNIIDHD